MKLPSDKEIVQCTREAFLPLEREFAFEAPEAERLSYELYVRYHRGAETVSVLFESTKPPMIELFLPVAGTSNAAVPWATRNGIRRYRRFPGVHLSEPWEPQNGAGLASYLQAFARAFVAAERSFLERNHPLQSSLAADP